MRQNPAFAITAVLTLALGIGANTAIFTVIRSVLLRPLEYRDPDRLVYLSVANSGADLDANTPLTPTRVEEAQAAAKSFESLGAYGGNVENVTFSDNAQPESVLGARVSANFLEILGVHPILGRSFLAEEDKPNGPKVVMISADFWHRRFNADSRIIGKTATLDAVAYTIVGVLPSGFAFPFPGMDVWFTRPWEWSLLPPRYWSIATAWGFGRLKPGATIEQARAEAEVLTRRYLAEDHGLDNGSLRIVWLKDRLLRNARPMLWMLFGAVGFVLLIACANVASLLLARATSRSREFALRAALGAGRGRLVGQLLAESLALSIAGGSLGAILAHWGIRAIESINILNGPTAANPLYLPGSGDIRLDGTVLAFTFAISIATGILFGLFPSLQMSRPNLAEVLRESGAAAGQGSKRRISPRSILVVGQVALSIVLLIGASLMIESFFRLHSVDPGFDVSHLITMKVALPTARYDTDLKKSAFFAAMVRRVENLPGVGSATAAMSLPTTRWIRTNIISVQSQTPIDQRNPPFGVIQGVTPRYFETMRIPLRFGREFTERDNQPNAPPTIIVNESLARKLWPDYPRFDPVGLHLGEGYDKFLKFEVIGVVADIHEGGLASEATPEFYIPTALHPPQTAYLIARTAGDPLSFVNSIRAQAQAIDPDQSVTDISTMESILDAKLGQRRATMMLLASFAAMAMLLAMIGIYGVIAYSVAQRTQEVGIRRALGAQQSDILKLVLGQGLILSLAGIGIGVGGAFALTRIIRRYLFQVSATDPATFVGIALLFILVALAASFLPARRASKIDPMSALRIG
jgi:predicted permease